MRILHLLVHFPNYPQHLNLGHAQAESWDLNLGLPRKWWELNHLEASPAAFQEAFQQEDGIGSVDSTGTQELCTTHLF